MPCLYWRVLRVVARLLVALLALAERVLFLRQIFALLALAERVD